jgi:hypothetical protein
MTECYISSTCVYHVWRAQRERLVHTVVAMFLRHGLSCVILRHRDDHFSSGVSISIVPESFRDLA